MFKTLIASSFALVLATISAAVAAQISPAPSSGAGKVAANFAQHKQQELERISNRIRRLQSLQTCVQGAVDHAAVKACNEAAHAT